MFVRAEPVRLFFLREKWERGWMFRAAGLERNLALRASLKAMAEDLQTCFTQV